MMKDPQQTIGNMADKYSSAVFVGHIANRLLRIFHHCAILLSAFYSCVANPGI